MVAASRVDGRAEAREWVRASGFEETRLAERRFPTVAELDAAVTPRPLRLRHATRHASVLNSAALAIVERALGPLGEAHAPGRARGLAVVYGLERELTDLVGPLPAAALRAALRATSAALARRGVGRLDEVTGANDAARAALLAEAAASGDVVQCVRLFVGDPDEAEAARRAVEEALAARGTWSAKVTRELAACPAAGPLVEIAGVKLFAHSSDDAASPAFAAAIVRARTAGLPVAVHAVEADVVAAVLDALACAPPRAVAGLLAGRECDPDRIEHASLCPPELARRLAAARVAVVTQPGFLAARGDKYLDEVEEPLWRWLYPLRTLLRSGVLVAAGSDSPVGPADPRAGLAGATLRRAASGRVLGPYERIDEAAALALYADAPRRLRGERAEAEARPSAWPRPGAVADVALLDRLPSGAGWRDLEAFALVVGGERVPLAAPGGAATVGTEGAWPCA